MISLPKLPEVALARRDTPLEPAPRVLQTLVGAGAPALYFKRDDLTGAELSGNKVRKLELLFGEALAEGADTVITCGGAQSNHCRATALSAARLGLRAILLLRTEDPAQPPLAEGNLLLDTLCGAEVRFISRADYQDRTRRMDDVALELRASGRRGYVIPEGGSNPLGSLGYVRCVSELAGQVPEPEAPLTLVYAAGSGGTGAGLILGVALHGLPWRVVGVNVCDDRAYFVERIGAILGGIEARFGLSAAAYLRRADGPDGGIEICDGFVGRGYAQSSPDELALLAAVCRASGVVLDPVYTGKAMFGLVTKLRADARSFGERVVFVHTGGIYGLLAQAAAVRDALGEISGGAARG